MGRPSKKRPPVEAPRDDVPDDDAPDQDPELELEEDGLPPAPPRDELLEPELAPQLPVQLSGFLEYSAPDKERWRCERANALIEDYRITGSNLTLRIEEWHNVMSAQGGVTWQTLRYWYRCAPLTGSVDPSALREWNKETLAQKIGVSTAKLETSLKETVDFWDRVQLEKSLAQKMVENSGVANLDEASILELIQKHGFDSMPVQEFPYIALRIMEMSNLFEMQEGRMLAQTAIFQELMIRNCQKSIGNLIKLGSDGKDLAGKLDQLKHLQTSYESTLEKLGATQEQNPSFRQRMAFNDSLGQITKAMQAYYAEKDHAIIDGVFTETEVKLLLTPTTLRPIQYRPDLSLLAQDWKTHFWNPDYEALKLPRDEHRTLMKAFEQAVLAQRSENGDSVPDMDESGESMLIDAEDALTGARVAEQPGEDVGAAMPDGDAVMPEDAARGRNRPVGGNDLVAI